ncbi:SpoIIAA family protein [Winogradskyella bathintestinalis]|uniref:STAS/SEC14 domain-containing protein n=1 Tax=Winogradskyella bathintestinalis TaxID=3035208 RepID=A0ABT7ZWD3_9FLAO|nr:STAS/SEC14 domain-containing protein [Winogradskyella bathintestinalis]MDN3493241.1 STAS/SEC14 domain-containing protein [Winogradskyella bathintestinalis]
MYETLTKADYTFLKKKMAHFDEKVSLLIEMGDFEGLTLQAFWEDLKMAFSSYGKIKNIALVSDKKVNALIKTADFVTPGLDLKLFTITEMHDAIEWLNK